MAILFFPPQLTQTQVDKVHLWIDALRSGKYSQTKRVLKDKKGFCCLGVACDLFDPTQWDIDESPVVNNSEIYKINYRTPNKLAAWELWPEEVARSFGMSGRIGLFFSEKNDNGASFKEIADILEKELKNHLTHYPVKE